MKNIIILTMSIVICLRSLNAAPLSDELIILHHATTSEVNAIVSPVQGSLIFNTDSNEIYEHNATGWNGIASDGSETKMIAGNCINIKGMGTSSSPYTISYLNAKTEETAGTTCKTIWDAECHSGDGIYWINPDGGDTSNAFQVYCDMKTDGDGGGWTRLEYTQDLVHQHHFDESGDAVRWLPSNFTLNLTDTQINDIRAASTEGKQTYRGTCDGVLHHYYNTGLNYNSAVGFRFHNGYETVRGQQSYAPTDITVIADGCKTNNSSSADTVFEIVDIRVPIVNIQTNDNGDVGEAFGSPLTNNHAWLR